MGPVKTAKQKVAIMLFILIHRVWLQNRSVAHIFGNKMDLEPTKTEQYAQSYGQMKLSIIFIANKKPRKLISFFAHMEKGVIR